MKIAVLEWSCGGGLQTTTATNVCESLCHEGWLMLRNLADGLAAAGCEVVVPVDLRGVPCATLREGVQIIDVTCPPPATYEDVISRWGDIASKCDCAWVIAPEIDGLLPQILERLRSEGQHLLNCHGDFLRNCTNKLLTAAALTTSGVPHPATTVLAEIDAAWLAATAPQDDSGEREQASAGWVIKPASGAGGMDQQLVTRQQLLQLKRRTTGDWLVQPWLRGRSASCTAIVDARGERHWLPLVSQDFRSAPLLDKHEHEHAFAFARANESAALVPQYVGCTFPCPELPRVAPRAMLEAALDALGEGAYGPVGVDLLFNPATQAWTVIEVNARCTSSLTAMAAAYRGNLLGDIFQLLTQSDITAHDQLCERLSPFQFRVASG